MKKTSIAAAAGVVLGIVGARYLFVGSWLIVVPWAITGLLLGYWGTKDESLVNGVTFGFVLSFVFMIAGYSGQPSLLSRIPIFLVLSAFGGIGGMVFGLAGFYVKAKIRPRKSKGEKPS
jgi:hypothetical protein